MPRNYQRKTDRQKWSEEAMSRALEEVKKGMPYKTASKQFSVPVMSLKRRAKGKNKVAVGAVKTLGSKQTVFSPDQEKELIQHITDMESRMYGLTKQDVLSLAYQLATKNNIKHPFSTEKERAGVDWLRGFRKRHPDIALRSPESTSAARARAFNKPVVDKFFSVLKDIQEKHHFHPHRIFNVDETSICTVPTKNTKVFAKAGRKQVARVTSAERGETTTAVICCSAAGTFLPPMFIFRRVRMKIELMDGAPPGSAYACNSSGWMKLEVFDQWFDHFLAHAKPSADDPVLLILDGHLSHTKNLNVVLKARENHVTILCLPPHCTHKLQPLDVGVMYPLSVYHNQELEKWMNNNPGRVVSVFQITKIFAGAYLRAAVPLNAINGFSKCGICPMNQDIFGDVDFVAAETTDMEAAAQNEVPSTSESALNDAVDAQVDQTVAVPDPQQPESGVYDTNTTDTLLINDCRTSSPQILDSNRTPTSSPSLLSQEYTHIQNDPPVSLNSTKPQEIGTVTASKSLLDLPSTSFGVYSPRDLRPLPKIDGKRSKNVRKRKIDTTVLTSTPYKSYLEEETQKKKEKEEEEEDAECLFCTEPYSKDAMGEGWIRCVECLKWGHEACAGLDSDDEDDFICDFCVDRRGNIRKQLDL
ncbi:tigger transposable element-derived protein 6-like [Amyelois transitella]|uniref:tigger transposable element-derived protein 6-like n=1 Tax=Amyelois transitella TaxID=680683 RepID=UPI00299008A3|nr:tigger transposable element-derived protein 6-like [Amyelois transitella]